MATRVDHYYISDAEMMREDPETMDALENLMYQVSLTPGIEVVVQDVPDILHGVKIVIRKESSNA